MNKSRDLQQEEASLLLSRQSLFLLRKDADSYLASGSPESSRMLQIASRAEVRFAEKLAAIVIAKAKAGSFSKP
jgi:hypothetical protein